jgi:hypothetical protein
MCIAILNQKIGGTLPSTTIYNSWENNDMGAGLLWNNSNNELLSFKTYDYDEFYNKYTELREDDDVHNIVLHFRIATSGINGIHNLHPFIVNDDLGFVHNGVISGLGNKEFSDTYEFNEMLKGFSHDFVTCQTTKALLEEYIGYSKLVFLRGNGDFDIFNEDLGHWDSGNWYSNDSYRAVNNWVYAGSKKVSKTTSIYPKEFSLSTFDSNLLTDFERELYVELCEYMGLDPMDMYSEEDIEMLMDEYNCVDIYALYDVFLSGQIGNYSNSYANHSERWDEFGS